MSKITLTDLVNLQNETTATNAINVNSAVIETAFDNTLSRDGTNPNEMEANLDMNSNRILNLPTPTSNYEPIRFIDVDTINAGGITVSPLPVGGSTNQVLGKNSSANFDVSWKDTHYIPIGGATGQVLSKSSATDYATTWTNSSTSAAGNGITIIPGSPNIIKLRDYVSIKDFGAVGDGVTDDAPAVRAAIAACDSGQGIYVPYSNTGYYMNSVVNNAVINLANKSIAILGDAWTIKTNGTYAQPKGSVFIIGSAIGDSDDFIHWKGTDAVFGASIKNIAVCGISNAFGGLNGRNIINIEAPTLTGDDFYLSGFTLENCFLCNGKTGYSFITSSDRLTNNGGGALCNSVIHRNQLCNIFMQQVGDNVTVSNNVVGQNTTVDSRNIGIYYSANSNKGVAQVRILNNNISSFSGSIVCDGCVNTIISGNEMETSLTATNLHGSMIDLRGFIDPVVNAVITGNTISQNSTIANYVPIEVNSSVGACISGNRIYLQSSYPFIKIDSSAQNTYVGPQTYYVGSSSVTPTFTDNGTFTSIQTSNQLSLAGSTSGNTRIIPAAVASGTLTLPAATDTLVGKATVDTLTNKTLTSPVLTAPILGTPVSGVATNLTGTASGLTAGNVTTNANLTGDVLSVGNATTLTNAPVIAKVLTGYVSGAGTVSASDSILSAIQKLNGNDATNANLTGPITSVGNATSIASQTGVGTKFVVDTSPTLITPALGTPSALVLTNATGLPMAAQSDQETATSTTLPVTPGRQQFHPSAAKAWGRFNSAGTVAASYNLASVTKVGTGHWTVTFTNALSSANYSVVCSCGLTGGGAGMTVNISSTAAGSFDIFTISIATLGVADPGTLDAVFFAVFGDI